MWPCLCVSRLSDYSDAMWMGCNEHKGKGTDIAVREGSSLLLEIKCRMLSQCYLPPGSGDFHAFTPAEAST